MQCIGATTFKEYKKYIETDKALERRFQSVRIAEPSEEQAKKILNGLREKYESHHHIEYSKEALDNAVSCRIAISRPFLPDKAIDLLMKLELLSV